MSVSSPFGAVRGTAYVPPTLEGRALVELGATLAQLRRDYDAALDRIDALAAQLRTAQAALAQLPHGYGDTDALVCPGDTCLAPPRGHDETP